MSANIYYRPAKPVDAHNVPTMAPQALLKAIGGTGNYNKSDLPMLFALQRVGVDGVKWIIEGISNYVEIEVYAEY